MLGTSKYMKQRSHFLPQRGALLASMKTDGENPGVLILYAPAGIILTVHELDCAVATCTESPWSNTTSCRTGGGIKFSFEVCRLSVPSHTIHYTAVKVNSHWHCHFYLESVFRMQEAAMERITDTSLACFSASSRRKLCLHCRHDNQHIPWVSTRFPLKASQNITVPTVITSFVPVHQWSVAGEKEKLVKYIMLSFNIQYLEHFCSKLLT